MNASRVAIEKVLQALPELTQFGMGLFERGKGLSPAEYTQRFGLEQAKLLADVETFTRVCDWLGGIAPRQTMSYGSYHLKHICESRIGTYVANGTFIAAAVHSGFPYRLIPHNPNVLFGMSRRSIQGGCRQRAAWNSGAA